MKKAAEQSVERHSFPATRLRKISAGPEWPIAAPIKWRTVTAQWETDPHKNTRARVVTACGSSHESWLQARWPVDPNGRGGKCELNTQRKSRELDGGCRRVGEKDGEGDATLVWSFGQLCSHRCVTSYCSLCMSTKQNSAFPLSRGLTFFTTLPFQTFLACKRQKWGVIYSLRYIRIGTKEGKEQNHQEGELGSKRSNKTWKINEEATHKEGTASLFIKGKSQRQSGRQ